MTTSRAAIFAGVPGQVALQDIALRQPGPGETLVRVLGCTLCGSDLHTFEGRRPAPTPTILGHEIVGRIEAFGPATPNRDLAGHPLQIGDRVTWSIVANCGQCFYCEHDLPQKCTRSVKYGHQMLIPQHELTGGLAEHCFLAPGTSLVRVPEQLPLELACPASCATATIAAAMEAAGTIAGRSVCVVGAGLLGLTACAMARSRGAREVICVEVQDGRRALAKRFGATRAVTPQDAADAVRELTSGRGVDVAFELSGSPAAFEGIWPSVRTGGTFVLVGSVFPAPPVTLSLEQVVRRQLTLRGVHNYAPRHLLAAINFLGEQHRTYPFHELVAEWHPLEDVARAFERASDPARIRVGVRMSEA